MPLGYVGSDWEYGDGQAGPCMGWCMAWGRSKSEEKGEKNIFGAYSQMLVDT